MGKRRTGRGAPPQSRQRTIPGTNIPDLDPSAKQKQEQIAASQAQAAFQQKIEAMSATIYSELIAKHMLVPDEDGLLPSKQEIDEAGQDYCDAAVDATLVFARRVLGVDAHRNVPPPVADEDCEPVEPLTDDD